VVRRGSDPHAGDRTDARSRRSRTISGASALAAGRRARRPPRRRRRTGRPLRAGRQPVLDGWPSGAPRRAVLLVASWTAARRAAGRDRRARQYPRGEPRLDRWSRPGAAAERAAPAGGIWALRTTSRRGGTAPGNEILSAPRPCLTAAIQFVSCARSSPTVDRFSCGLRRMGRPRLRRRGMRHRRPCSGVSAGTPHPPSRAARLLRVRDTASSRRSR
jgi:hypothetical protein